jgi:phosphorylcholine metabolism protein LicD
MVFVVLLKKNINLYSIMKQYPPDLRENYDTNIEQVQSVVYRMLQIIDSICEEFDINYWLDYGTLLGAVRHHGFIPWDFEADIGMLRSDYIVFKEIIEKELPEDLFFQCEETDPEYIFFPVVEAKIRDKYSNYIHDLNHPDRKWHNGIQVDIFVYDIDNKFENCISNAFERNFSKSKIHLLFEEIGYTEKQQFNDHQFPIPIGYDQYLQRNYGDYKILPPIEERNPPYVEVFTPCNHPETLDWYNKL